MRMRFRCCVERYRDYFFNETVIFERHPHTHTHRHTHAQLFNNNLPSYVRRNDGFEPLEGVVLVVVVVVLWLGFEFLRCVASFMFERCVFWPMFRSQRSGGGNCCAIMFMLGTLCAVDAQVQRS